MNPTETMTMPMNTSVSMNLTIINHSTYPIRQAFLKSWVKRLAQLSAKEINPQRYRGFDLMLVFLSEPAMKALNQKFRGKNASTDVLSFEPVEEGSLGELVICPAVISRQAREHRLLVREEMGYMVLHGFLHLLGYDHETNERDAKKMFDLQDRLFEKMLGHNGATPKRHKMLGRDGVKAQRPVAISKRGRARKGRSRT